MPGMAAPPQQMMAMQGAPAQAGPQGAQDPRARVAQIMQALAARGGANAQG